MREALQDVYLPARATHGWFGAHRTQSIARAQHSRTLRTRRRQASRGSPSPGAGVAEASKSRRRCGRGEPVPAQMWQNELSPGADVAGASPVPTQMWQVGHCRRTNPRLRERDAQRSRVQASRAVTSRYHAVQPTVPGGIPCRAGYRAAVGYCAVWDTVPCGIMPCRARYHVGRDALCRLRGMGYRAV